MEQKVSIVTGGSRGIGAEICRRLSSLGYNVVLCYNNSEESAKAIAESHDNIFIYKIDVSQADQIKALVDWTYEKFGRIDLLVNNAGIDMFSPIQDYSNEEIDIYEISCALACFIKLFAVPVTITLPFFIIPILSDKASASSI